MRLTRQEWMRCITALSGPDGEAPASLRAVRAIAEKFGGEVDAVAAYPRFQQRVPATAITLEMEGITPESPDDIGTEQFQGNVRFAAVPGREARRTRPRSTRSCARSWKAEPQRGRPGCACSAHSTRSRASSSS